MQVFLLVGVALVGFLTTYIFDQESDSPNMPAALSYSSPLYVVGEAVVDLGRCQRMFGYLENDICVRLAADKASDLSESLTDQYSGVVAFATDVKEAISGGTGDE